MTEAAKSNSQLLWVLFALGTVISWGLYGAMLHKGALGFGGDRIKAFLFVGVAYFLVAVLAPLAVLAAQGGLKDFGSAGIKWSLAAGTLGAVGALFVLFALNANPVKGPAAASQVMSLIFAGAPVVAALFGLLSHKTGAPLNIPWQFIVGLVLAATGGCLVTLFKPS